MVNGHLGVLVHLIHGIGLSRCFEISDDDCSGWIFFNQVGSSNDGNRQPWYLEGESFLYSKNLEVIFRIPGVPVPIIGATDLVEEDPSGAIIITDFKTSGKAYSVDEVDKNPQMTIYQMAFKKNGYKDREILLKFDALIKTKTPKFEQYWTTRSDADERRMVRRIKEVWNGINKEVFVPNDTSWKCKGCHYQQACKDWFEKGEG